jgi:hypothetical protein
VRSKAKDGSERARPRGALARRVQWGLDRFVSKGPVAVIAAACILVLTISAIGGLLTLAVSSGNLANSAWNDFTQLLGGPGVQQGGAWSLRLISLAMVLVGIVFVSLVIGLVVTVLQDSIDRVRNGSPPLRDVPDLAILGWSDQLFTLLREFAVAEDGRSAAVVSTHPRAWMDEQIRRECGAITDRLRIDCRTADRADPRDLGLVRIGEVPTIVIFGEPQDRDDASVVKSIFATVTASSSDSDHLMIAEVCGQAVTRSLADVFDRRLLTVDTNELLALVMAQSVRDQGMGQLLDQLTSYRGCEFYDHPLPAGFVGSGFGDMAWSLLSASPVGIVRGDDVCVLPPPAMLLEAGDRVLVVDQTRRPLTFVPPNGATSGLAFADPAEPCWSSQQILMIGWNKIVRRAVEHLRGFLGDGSSITVLVDTSSMSPDEVKSLQSCGAVDRTELRTSSANVLAAISGELADNPVDAVAIVPYRDAVMPSQADAATLVALTTARATIGTGRTRIVTELRETRAAALTTLVRPDDLVLSDAVTASTMAQLADRPWLDGVLADLLDWHGSAFFIYGPERALNGLDSGTVSFLGIRRAMLERGELAIGLRVDREVVLNPPASQRIAFDTITGVVAVGAGVGWNTGNIQARMADVL